MDDQSTAANTAGPSGGGSTAGAASPQQSQSSERGLLHLSVEFSSRDITAGNDFSLFVLVTNPFPNPVRIGRVHVSLPSELRLAGQEDNRKLRTRFRTEETKHTAGLKKDREALRKPLIDLWESLQAIRAQLGKKDTSGPDIDGLSEHLANVEKTLRAVEEGTAGSQIILEGGEIRNVDMASHSSRIRVEGGFLRNVTIQEPWLVAENRSLTQEVELQSSLPPDADLQPGNTVVFTTVIRAKNAIMMSPSKFRLQFSVNYSFPPSGTSAVHTNTISQEVSIRAPVYSVMLGAVIGGFFGSVARVLAPTSTQATAISPTISILLSVILGAAAVVFLARKSDAQAFVSVEDIWGGALIGFLVGYSGTSFFDQLAKITR